MHPFRAAVQAHDLDAVSALFAPDIVFRSPVAHTPYEGRDVVTAIIRAAFEVFEHFEYEQEIGAAGAADHALVFRAKIGDLDIHGADFLHTGADGLIDEFTVMLRPLRATTAFAERMAVEFGKAITASR